MSWSLTEYNLIVYGNDEDTIFSNVSGSSAFPADRLFEYTEHSLKNRYENNLVSLGKLPTLVVAEIGFRDRTPAFFGRIDEVERRRTRVHLFQHLFDRLTSEEVFLSRHFDVARGSWFTERHRTHWAVKEGNLIEELFRLLKERSDDQRPRLFNLEQWPLPILGHIAVMMPFDVEFNPVYEAIKSACESRSLKPLRVDEIYGPRQIVDDVFSAIAQSSLVISDLTGRNPNVLYETGLAHALNRDVIVIVQNDQDIPFDLGHIRYVRYLPNEEGLEKLKNDLAEFIQSWLA